MPKYNKEVILLQLQEKIDKKKELHKASLLQWEKDFKAWRDGRGVELFSKAVRDFRPEGKDGSRNTFLSYCNGKSFYPPVKPRRDSDTLSYEAAMKRITLLVADKDGGITLSNTDNAL